MSINNIILAGDSAGGNLITALTVLIIKKGYKVPLAVVSSYPAFYVGTHRFVPSILLSLDDILLPSKFLKHAIAAYSGNISEDYPECTGDKLDLMSPLLASDEILSKFPQTMINICQNDPLRDFGI